MNMITSTKRMFRERRFMEFSLTYIWPVYRQFIKRHLTKRCMCCAISSRLEILGDNGVCTLCSSRETKNSDPITPALEKEMEDSLNKILILAQGKGGFKYDALVFFSGGKDSCYMLFKLKKEYPKLRLLAISVDNSFMSPIALENIEQTIRKLDVDHIFYRPGHHLYEKIFQYVFTHLNGKGMSEALDILDAELRFDIGRHLAANLHIPLILIGLSRGQVLTYGGAPIFDSGKLFEEATRKKAGIYDIADIPLSPEESAYWWDGTLYKKKQVARVLFPFVVWNFGEEFLMKEVVGQGLISPKKAGPLLTNHQLIILMGLVDMVTYGYSSWEREFAQMIRGGKANKKYWQSLFEMFEYSAKTGIFIGKSVDEMLLRLNLTRKDLGLPLKKR